MTVQIAVDMQSPESGLVYFPNCEDVHWVAKEDDQWYCETYQGAYYGKTKLQAITKAARAESFTGPIKLKIDKEYRY